MNHDDIRYAITKAGYTLSAVALELDVSRSAVSACIRRRADRSTRVEKRISEITGISLELLFPERYPRRPA